MVQPPGPAPESLLGPEAVRCHWDLLEKCCVSTLHYYHLNGTFSTTVMKSGLSQSRLPACVVV